MSTSDKRSWNPIQHAPGVGHVVASSYLLEELLGQGGMGAVYRARHLEIGHEVAIKIATKAADGDDARAAVLREARLTARLSSNRVPRIHALGVLPGGFGYLVMELLGGCDLQSELEASGPLSVAAAVDCLLEVCIPLREAHEQGIVHNDVKPANILRARCDSGTQSVKLLDFGIARSTELDDRSGALRGSPGFVAPERMREPSLLDAKTDIWALGVTLHVLLTGRMPFIGKDTAEIVSSVASDLRTERDHARVPRALMHAIDRCLRPLPADRFASVADFARALAPFASPAARGALDTLRAPPCAAVVAWPRASALDATLDLAELRRAPTRTIEMAVDETRRPSDDVASAPSVRSWPVLATVMTLVTLISASVAAVLAR